MVTWEENVTSPFLHRYSNYCNIFFKRIRKRLHLCILENNPFIIGNSTRWDKKWKGSQWELICQSHTGKKQVNGGDPCRPLNYPNGKRQEDRINRMLFYGNYHSFDQQLCQKISKGTGFSFIHQALVPGFGHTVHLDKKQDQWETGCRSRPLEQWFKQTQRTAKGR